MNYKQLKNILLINLKIIIENFICYNLNINDYNILYNLNIININLLFDIIKFYNYIYNFRLTVGFEIIR